MEIVQTLGWVVDVVISLLKANMGQLPLKRL